LIDVFDVDQNDEEEAFSGKLVVVDPCPFDGLQVGEVTGVAIDHEGSLHVLHRADRHWAIESRFIFS